MMGRITVSLVSMMICTMAMADARLPMVNLASAAVSARAAFGEGETPAAPAASAPAATATNATRVAGVKQAPAAPQKDKNKAVLARQVKPRAAVKTAPAAPVAMDAGEQMASAEILAPRRPSHDLWATADAPLRMPAPQEFAVIRSDDPLPEESLTAPVTVAAANPVAMAPVASAPAVVPADTTAHDVAQLRDSTRALDDQIAKLIDLQKKADRSVARADARLAAQRASVPAAQASVPVASIMSPVASVAERVAPAPAAVDTDAPAVAVRQMVVPMDAPVITRPVPAAPAAEVKIARAADNDLSRLNPAELKKAFKKTYLSENKHLSTFQIDNRFDVASDMTTTVEGFTAVRDLSESGGVRPLEIKIKFRGDDASLSRENYNLLTEYASIVVSNPKRAIQVSIPQRVTVDADDRKLAARRLAIVEQVLRDTGVSEQRIMPVLAQRDDEGLVLRIISSDQFETLTQQKRDMFGDTVSKKTYKSMSW